MNSFDATRIVKSQYGLDAENLSELPSDRDQNLLLETGGERYVLKVANPGEKAQVLDFQNKAMMHLRANIDENLFPRVVTTVNGDQIVSVYEEGQWYKLRLLTYLPGVPLVDVKPHTNEMLREIGGTLGNMAKTLSAFSHPAMERKLHWDLAHAGQTIREKLEHIQETGRWVMADRIVAQFEKEIVPLIPELRKSVIHNDANDYNILLAEVDKSGTGFEPRPVVGVIDFGDMVYSCTVFELAVACAYVMLGKEKPLEAAAQVVVGFHQAYPLMEKEIEVLFLAMRARLCLSVTMAAFQRQQEPDNEYLSVTEAPAWELLKQLEGINPDDAQRIFWEACNLQEEGEESSLLLAKRKKILGHNLSIAYRKHLTIVRGEGQYLYDEEGQAYLDCVNNVSHVGHSHPKVVQALQKQAAILNTNTRYLHPGVVELAERLTATMPESLSVCYFVCTGSEANELALRLARAHTGRRDFVVLDGAYHGNSSALVDLSPYKFKGSGGAGEADYVHTVEMPDGYRGPYKTGEGEIGTQYADKVRDTIKKAEEEGSRIAGFLCESLLGCGGQVILPENYLAEAYKHVRAAGGVCIADEVQVGFGRVGTHYWGFETQGVVPDIVTVGKPFGNGHPLAAVVTTPEIAASFDNGMEYFNTFGGNPVSAAVGLAVMDVIEEEGLQANALEVGKHLKAGLLDLRDKHPIIGDVRGLGLFVGAELVLDRETLEPAPRQANYIAERMREQHILISTDGPLHNVLKIKPPMVFTKENADEVVRRLDEVMGEDFVSL
ncbi:MAG: aminotransferase class III-fold pyridoxal phosphate-dependent enzyme [Chloroflexi bacterium]|nr:MAG: aminotransferase class III-fold pyridoxal phosphate-dependent enzyme [Chloroflexota bacterium]MBL1193925.1 aminotransferase class III-fold pyridoxal phosphate-dependent enzyme [Chloroflexota bacterium]NOH11219.1 aminotransferase class III-fold pyridoxal phosphate-dependent enzyme [Chloroflexota bacterium]